MRIEFASKPLDCYVQFHTSSARERLLGGGFGSGKTYALCDEAIALGLEQPGSRILLTRKTMPELRDTLEPVFVERLPPALYEVSERRRLGGHIADLTLPNGTKFLFRSMDDWRKHKSLNLAAIFWDELSEFDEESYMGMMGRLRQREPTAEGQRYGASEITRRFSAAATNPDGHSWVWERFVRDSSRAVGAQYWEATSLDNPYLPREYLEHLFSYPEPWIKRYVLCNWDDFAGKIYDEWSWDTHVVHDFVPRAEDFMWMGMDVGMDAPTAGLWAVVDRPNNRLVVVHEYQESNLAAEPHALEWKGIEARPLQGMRAPLPVRWRVADPNIMTRDKGTAQSLHSQYARLGFTFETGPVRHKDRIPMLAQLVHQKRIVTTPNCPRFFEQMREYRWEDLTPMQRARGVEWTEKPRTVNDHLVDCGQYLSSRYTLPFKPPTPQVQRTEWEDFSRQVHRDAKRQILAGRMPAPHDLGTLGV